MALTRRRCDGQGVSLTTSYATIFTFNGSLAGAGGMLQGVKLANKSGTLRVVTIQLVPSGGAVADSQIIGVVSIPATSDDTWFGPLYADSGATVRARMDGGTAGDVIAHTIAIEES